MTPGTTDPFAPIALDVDEIEQLGLWVDHLRDLDRVLTQTPITLFRDTAGVAYARLGDLGEPLIALTHSKRTPDE